MPYKWPLFIIKKLLLYSESEYRQRVIVSDHITGKDLLRVRPEGLIINGGDEFVLIEVSIIIPVHVLIIE